MRVIATVLLLGSSLLAARYLSEIDPTLASLVAIAIGVTLAGLASGGFTPGAVAMGALGALAFTTLEGVSNEIAGGAFVTLIFGARAIRARSSSLRGLHVVATIVCGAFAIWLSRQFVGASIGVQSAAVLVSGVASCAALLVPADDRIAFALIQFSREAEEPLQTTLLRAALMRRRVLTEDSERIAVRAQQRLEGAWEALVKTARTRADARGASAEVLDQRIRSHVDALDRVYAAADERLARASGLEDRSLTATRMEGDALAAEVSALAEIDSEPKNGSV